MSTFTKLANGNVLYVANSGEKIGLMGALNVLPHPSEDDFIILTDSAQFISDGKSFKFDWQDVTLPVGSTDRNDLIEELSTNFFFNLAGGSSITIPIASIGIPSYTTIQDEIDASWSSGLISGGIVTDAGGATIDISLAEIAIRNANSQVAPLYTAQIASASGIAITVNSIRYVGCEYNAGTPQFVVRTMNNFNGQEDFLIATIVNEGGTLHIVNNPQNAGNTAFKVSHRLYETEPYKRAERLGGLGLGEKGTRNITLSAGELYDALNEFIITEKDTSIASTFASYYGTTQQAAAATQWDNDNYNNAGTLTSLTVGRYANVWFYVEADDSLVMVYGTAQYTSSALAENEAPPPLIPLRLEAHGRLIGRILFIKGGATAILIENAFDTIFSPTLAAFHGNQAGLGNDDHLQYALLIGRVGGQVINGGTSASDNLKLVSNTNGTKGKIELGSVAASAYDEVNDRLGLGTNAPVSKLDVRGQAEISEIRYNAKITPASLGTNQNDYAPTGLQTNGVLELTASTNVDITGLDSTNMKDLEQRIIFNAGSSPIKLKVENVGSLAANRFAIVTDFTISPNMFVTLMYSTTLSRWVKQV